MHIVLALEDQIGNFEVEIACTYYVTSVFTVLCDAFWAICMHSNRRIEYL